MRSTTIEMGSLEGFSPSSAEIVASSDDLLSEILLRLPVKSLLRFKFVSKHWLSLIADPQFCRRRSHNPEPPTALFVRSPAAPSSYENHLSFVPLDPSQTSAPIKFLACTRHPPIVQSSHGLFFCRSSEFGSDPKWYVYNPTTKQLTTLPPLPGPSRYICWMTLAFDPSESHFYKVICTQFSAPSASSFCVQVYSSETRSWGRCAGPFESGYREPWFFLNFTGGVYWKGAMHWLSQAKHSLCFDVNKEVVGEMPMPPAPERYELRGIRYFGESVGHLHLVQFCEDFQGEFDVFEMERDRSGWFVKFRVDLNGVAMAYPGRRILKFITSAAEFPGLEGLEVEEDDDNISACRFAILCVVRGKKEEDSFLVIRLPGEIIAYNFNTRSHWKICDADRPFEPYLWDLLHPKFDAFQYTESLSLV